MEKKRLFENALDGVGFLAEKFATICLFTLIALVSADVIGRYLLGSPLRVSDEVGGYLLVGITFWGAAHTFQKGLHVRVNIIIKQFPEKFQRIITLIVDSLGLIFIIIIIFQSTKVVVENIRDWSLSPTSLRMPMFIPQMSIPIGLGIMSISIIRHLIEQLRRSNC